MTHHFTAADGPGIINARCSLADAPCPYCHRARLTFDAATRTNTCPGCGGEVVTEWEWERRLEEMVHA